MCWRNIRIDIMIHIYLKNNSFTCTLQGNLSRNLVNSNLTSTLFGFSTYLRKRLNSLWWWNGTTWTRKNLGLTGKRKSAKTSLTKLDKDVIAGKRALSYPSFAIRKGFYAWIVIFVYMNSVIRYSTWYYCFLPTPLLLQLMLYC